MWKVWVIPSLCNKCNGEDKKCEEYIPWLTSQNDQTLYINTLRASASELCDAAEQAESNCPMCAVRIKRE